jgi:hypothetical protein
MDIESLSGTANAFPRRLVPQDGCHLHKSRLRAVEVRGSGKEQSSMLRRLGLVLAAASGSLAATGCGNPPGLYPVSGKVAYKGEPAAGAVVYFHREGPSSTSPRAIPSGIVEDDGSFFLSCDGVGDGCPPGEYAVLIEWRGKSETPLAQPKPGRVKAKARVFTVNRQMARQGVDRLKGRCFDIAKPLLHAKVEPHRNTLPPFELGD